MKAKAARYCIGFLLLGILLAKADFANILSLSRQLRWVDTTLGFVTFFATGLLDMWRLRLASSQARAIRLRKFFRIHFESYIMAQMLPGQMGMDVYRIGMIGKSGGGYLQSTVILFLFRAFNTTVMFFILIAAVLLFPERNYLHNNDFDFRNFPAWSIPVFALIFFLGLWLGVRIMRRVLARRIQERLDRLILAFKEVRASLLAQLAGISLGIIATRIVTFHFTLGALGIEVGPVYTVTVALAATFAWLLPISPGGIGIREGIIVALLARAGIGFDQALLVALLNRIYFTSLGAVGGLLLLLPKNQASRDRQ